MVFKIYTSLYKPTKINADYKYNTDYNFFSQAYNKRFNCPWENKLEIDGEFLGVTSLNISVSIDTNKFMERTIEKIIKKIFECYEKQKITISLKKIKTIDVLISDKYLKDLISFEEFVKSRSPDETIDELEKEYKDKIEKKERRGFSFIYTNHTAKIFISLNGCDLTIHNKNKKWKFENHYPEYAHIKWTLEGLVYYVLAHEMAHIIVPIDRGEEIYPIILGSRFAFENHYIAVPQGRELNDAWDFLGITLSKKLNEDNLKYQLNECKKWLESLVL